MAGRASRLVVRGSRLATVLVARRSAPKCNVPRHVGASLGALLSKEIGSGNDARDSGLFANRAREALDDVGVIGWLVITSVLDLRF